jgi:hypothetical protein
MVVPMLASEKINYMSISVLPLQGGIPERDSDYTIPCMFLSTNKLTYYYFKRDTLGSLSRWDRVCQAQPSACPRRSPKLPTIENAILRVFRDWHMVG